MGQKLWSLVRNHLHKELASWSEEYISLFVMQSYPPRVLDRRLQEAWARVTKEGPIQGSSWW